MKVYVTHEQFAAIQEMRLRADTTSDPRDLDALMGQLAAACLDNGGDYNPELHRAGVAVALIVIQ